MRWQDKAVILHTKPHGESRLIVELMSRHHGRHFGVVKGGRSRQMRAVIQAGNFVSVDWWARLDEHLGSFRLDIDEYSANRLLNDRSALCAFMVLAEHLTLLPEREPHSRLFDLLALNLAHIDELLIAGELMVRFELALLEELGFGLDLSSCVVTGQKEHLIYVSPRSGRAVSAQAGHPWRDKLINLPEFLLSNTIRTSDPLAIIAGFTLTGFFLERHVWVPRAIHPPITRARFIRYLAASLN